MLRHMSIVSSAAGQFVRSRTAVMHHHGLKRSLERTGSAQSRHALDWMNFFTADMEVSFGTFVPFYLASLNWSQENIGFAMTAGQLTGALFLIPGGALTDAVRWKRAWAATGLLMVASAALILALKPSLGFVLGAEALHGASAGFIPPAIAAISLGIVGRQGMSTRTGRNYRFEAAGNALTALVMGAVASYFGANTIFLIAAALTIPALVALSFIRSDEINYARARNASMQAGAPTVRGVLELAKNRQLLWFAGCLALFQLADSSMLPLAAEHIGAGQSAQGSLLASGLVVVPQIVVAFLAPWSGYLSELWGRKPLLLTGFGVEVVRAGLLSVINNPILWLPVQVLNGISGGIITVLTVVVVTDLTARTGRFNLARGGVGLVSTTAAALGLSAFGFVAQHIGNRAGFLSMAAVAAAGTLLAGWTLSETKPTDYAA
jgi:MFS family permease